MLSTQKLISPIFERVLFFLKPVSVIILENFNFLAILHALIIFLDTFKIQINNFFPGFGFLLENFYETLKDIYLFTIDLIK